MSNTVKAAASMKPVKAEALNETVTFVYDGDTYTVPAADDLPLEVLEALEDGKVGLAARVILGEQYDKVFKAKPRRMKDLNDLFEALTDATGLGN